MSVEALNLNNLPSPPQLSLRDAALFLDLDGTLAPIAARPDDVQADPRRTRLLERLKARLEGRLAVVSGRTLADIDRILEGRIVCVAAVHGLVRRDGDGTLHEARPHRGLVRATQALRTFAARDPRLIVEEKGPSVALHFRMAPAHQYDARRLTRRLAAETGLALQNGDMVEELRTPGPDKGDSIHSFMQTAAFHGSTPIFAGDDVTDEHGFLEVRRVNGIGVLVGRPRPTAAAAYGLRGVEDLLAWLEAAR